VLKISKIKQKTNATNTMLKVDQISSPGGPGSLTPALPLHRRLLPPRLHRLRPPWPGGERWMDGGLAAEGGDI